MPNDNDNETEGELSPEMQRLWTALTNRFVTREEFDALKERVDDLEKLISMS